MTNNLAKRLFNLFISVFLTVFCLLILLLAETIRLPMLGSVFSIQERDLPF